MAKASPSLPAFLERCRRRLRLTSPIFCDVVGESRVRNDDVAGIRVDSTCVETGTPNF